MNHFFDWGEDEDKAVYVDLEMAEERSAHAKAMSEAKPSAYNRPFGRYFKDVSNLNAIDVYKVLELFGVKSHALGHAVKKILVAGARGGKDEAQDIREAIAALERHLEILDGK